MTEPMDAKAARVITSRMSSKCKRCGKWIGPDERIVFTPGGGAVHIDDARCARALPGGPVPVLDFPNPEAYWAEYEWVGRQLEAHPWTFAKTMPEIPHCWSVRRQWSDSEAFTHAVLRIRQFGTRRKFRSMTNIKLDVNEHYYWTMDSPLSPPEVPTLINRAVRLQYEPAPPTWFETWPSVSKRQSSFLRRHVGGLRGRDVLDIGATWADAAARARRYVAIGPPGDLARLAVAPSVSTIETSVRGFVPRDPDRFDIVAATFGAANHLDLDELVRLPQLVRPGGCVMAMFVLSGPGHAWSPALWPDALLTQGRAYTLVRVQR